LRDQYTVELYYRLQVLKHLAITPDIQVLVNPALNSDTDVVGVFGLRARLAF
jgi:porin